jgi:hypothetical protein
MLPLLKTVAIAVLLTTFNLMALSLSNSIFNVQIGQSGEISSLKLAGDLFPTDYVMNAANVPALATADHEWVGELMFTYKLGAGAWQTALSQASGDGRTQSQSGNIVIVTYQNSSAAKGIKNFKVEETYSLTDKCLLWAITVTNTSTQSLEIGDFGLPLPFNEIWPNEEIYETRVVYHANVANNNSYIYAKRPSGMGPFLLMVPDTATGAGFEYRDRWVSALHSGSKWAANDAFPDGLQVYYIHSNVIKSTNRSYLPNTSLILDAGQSKTYSYKFFNVADDAAMKEKLYSEGLIDVTVVPGMIVPTNMPAKIDLHTSKSISSIEAPIGAAMTFQNTVAPDHKIYSSTMSKLGQNNFIVNYGANEKTVLQFYALESNDSALQRHATFMVNKQQYNTPGKYYDKLFDDWMMDPKAKRGSWGTWGWGDDWGWTHGDFLAEKQVYSPVAIEAAAVDEYLETAVWNGIMKDHQTDYKVNDWLIPPGGSGDWFERSFAYPHCYNTFFSMYKVAKLYPDLITYKNPKKTYLLRAYNIYKSLWTNCAPTGTGLMGEQTTPELITALQDEGLTTEANYVISTVTKQYNGFSGQKYPYGSEYNYDNTGEEAVYMMAKYKNKTDWMEKINQKTRACRGSQPLWYYYANPITICGSGWWNFQYSAALIGYCMDDWTRYNSKTPELDQRMSFAAKLANLSSINSGQIDSDPANIGTVAWTYQASLGNEYEGSADGGGKLHNGWRNMSGEADLGLWGSIRILSSDVAIDPVFGLFGYGCTVTKSGPNFVVTPKDGIYKRINMISLKLYLTAQQDNITSGTISDSKDFIELAFQKTTMTAHKNIISISGFKNGSYKILVDNVESGTVIVESGKTAVADFSAGTSSNYGVKIGTPSSVKYLQSNIPVTYELSIGKMTRSIFFSINSSLKINRRLPTLSIYSSAGSLVKCFKKIDGNGIHWNLADCKVRSGTYFASITGPDNSRGTVKMFMITQ